MSDLVQIALTNDRFESDILAQAVRAEGYTVQLVHRDELGSGTTSITRPSYLLAHDADAEAIREILARSIES